jgi:hypothetical protein
LGKASIVASQTAKVYQMSLKSLSLKDQAEKYPAPCSLEDCKGLWFASERIKLIAEKR